MIQVSIPNYTLLDKIYEGKHSLIFSGYQQSSERPIVVKFLKVDYPTPLQLNRFKYEYEITHKLFHALPHKIIEPLELIKYQNTYGIVLEKFGDCSIDKIIQTQPINISKFLELSILIVEALGHIHANNILHKDINPSNILVDIAHSQIKFIDFGISTTLSFEWFEAQNVNAIEGTLSYISPEQTGRMNRVLDYRSDYYSLGVTFYEMLTGTLPFLSQDSMELVYAHLAKTPLSPHQYNSEIPLMISNIVMKLLSKTPEERYQSTFGIVEDLKRCLHEYKTQQQILEFSLGEKDISTRFHISEKLYGRENEIDILMQNFAEVVQSRKQLTLISGTAGIGKSALVHEIHKPIAAQKGYYVFGKCDQYKRNLPYEPIIQALQRLFQQILTESPDQIYRWKRILQRSLGNNGKIITDLIPQAKLLLGPQPPLDEINHIESQKRFRLVFENFIQSLASNHRPITIFLDDLQWIDYATLDLISHIFTSTVPLPLFIIGAYRSNEITEHHELNSLLDELNNRHIPYTSIQLSHLELHHIIQMLSEALHQPTEKVRPLAELCQSKTQGNPFFLNRLLLSLYEDRMIYMDIVQGIWRWDLERIKRKDISDNVVEFMSKKILELPSQTQKVIQLAACTGNTFDLRMLSFYNEKSLKETTEELWEAIQEGLLVPENENYKYIDTATNEIIPYRFLHDRVQQAAYTLIPEEERRKLHYKIGKISLEKYSEQEIEQHLFTIVNHFNQGAVAHNDEERRLLIQLNLKAGLKAKLSAAFHTAITYFQKAKSYTVPEDWTTHYSEMQTLNQMYSQSLYFIGEFPLAQENLTQALDHAKDPLEKAEIMARQVVLKTDGGKIAEAIQSMLDGLKILGLELTRNPSILLVIKEALLTKWYLRGKKPSDLLDLPPITDPRIKLIYQLMENCAAATYFAGDQNLTAIMALKQFNIVLKYGSIEGIGNSLVAYIVMLTTMNDLKTAKEYADVLLKLNEKTTNKNQRSRVFGLYAHMIRAWHYHWKTLKPYFKDSIQGGYESGNMITYTLGITYILLEDPEINQEQLVKESKKTMQLLKSTRSPQAEETAKIQFQVRASLCGLTKTPFDLDDEEFNEKECYDRMKKNNFLIGISKFHLARSILHFHFDDYIPAYEHLKQVDSMAETIPRGIFYIEYICYSFFILSAIYPQLKGREKRQVWSRMKKTLQTLTLWSDHCPVNFSHHKTLMEAEIAKHEQRINQAIKLYNEAIRLAKTNEYIRYEALFNEIAAKFYISQGIDNIAKLFLYEARYCYQKWGVNGKIKQLEEKYPDLLPSQRTITTYTDLSTTTTTSSISEKTSSQVLDFISVVKASQAITREIQLNKLIEKMMRIVLENAGAEKGYLILEKDDHYSIEAYAEHENVQIAPPLKLEELSHSIIMTVASTKEPIVIDDALQDERFKTDAILIKNNSKSILCYPLLNLGIMKGMLYLENNLAKGVFTKERFDIIGMLSSQMAISIDNARFYAELENKVAERTQELRDTQNQLIQKEKMAFLGVLTTGIGHEMKNPLNFIINFSGLSQDVVQELLKIVLENPELKLKELPQITESLRLLQENIESTFQQGKKADTIVNRMIEHSAITGQQFVQTDLTHLIEQSIKINERKMKELYPDFDVIINTEYNHTLSYIKAADIDLQRVFINLLDNAYYALYHKMQRLNSSFTPVITIKTSNDHHHFEIQIIDNGEGIAQQYIDKIFTPFFTTRPTGQGVGLGLSLCHNIIVKEHGGTFTFETKENVFTNFIIQLPISREEN